MSDINDMIERNKQLLAGTKFHESLAASKKQAKQKGKKSRKPGRPKGRRKVSVNGKGYSYVYDENGKLVLKHRVLMEQHLGRKLLPHEAVYFIDENKENITIENLALGIKPGRHKIVTCPNCECNILEVKGN